MWLVRIGVVVKAEAGFNIEVGYHGEVVNNPCVESGTVLIAINTDSVRLYIPGTGDVETGAEAKVWTVVRVVDYVLGICPGETCEDCDEGNK